MNSLEQNLGPLVLPLVVAGIFILIVMGLMAAFVKAFGKKEFFPYGTKPILTNAEAAFYPVLQQCVPQGTALFCKVRLADFLEVVERREEFMKHFARISQKHVDFLVVDGKTFSPLLIVELDDSTHKTSQRTIESDKFKDQAFEAANVPILRVPVARKYDPRVFREDMVRLISERARRK